MIHRKGESMIEVIEKDCVGCGVCRKACAYGAITIVDKTAEIDTDKCTLCGSCVSACPFGAIFVRRTSRVVETAESAGIWVFAEQRHGQIAPVSLELLGKARELADDSGQQLTAILFGHKIEELATSLVHHGADRVLVVDHPQLADFLDIPYAYALTELIHRHHPEIVLSGATAMGRSFIPRVAVQVHTGLTADCTGLVLDPDNGNLLQTRPAFGGNIMATIRTPDHRPQMATVRHKVMTPLAQDPTRVGSVVREEIEFPAQPMEFLESVQDEGQTVQLAEADFVVSGGRGLKEAKNFEMLRELAAQLDAAVGASRAAVDAEWIAYPHQVGQTGKTIKPTVYLAVGISGAIQHLAGMQSSDYIIAINKDPDAPIFKVADFGIVGDLFEIIPRLTRKLKGLQA
jgi:electron transfer flavoprotein alpha subunit